MPLTVEGYQKDSPETIKQDLIKILREKIPDFAEQAADIQDDILDTSISDILYFENLLAVMLNAYSFDYSSQDLFRKQAEEVGLRPKGIFKSQVTLTFMGAPGDIIPRFTKVSKNSDPSIYFETDETIVIDSTGSAVVKAYGEVKESIPEGQIQNIITVLQEGIAVTNNEASLASIEEEPFEEFKLRSQARLRSPRMGGRLYAESCLNTLAGVNPRLVNFYNRDFTELFENVDSSAQEVARIKGIEAVIGGGDDYQVAKVLYTSFFETQKLMSLPSDNDENRKKNVELYLYNTVIPVNFTRPKELPLYLMLKITFNSNLISAQAVQALCLNKIENYVNTLKVGTPLTTMGLANVITPIMADAGFGPDTILSIDFSYDCSKDYSLEENQNEEKQWKPFDNGAMSDLKFDCYCTLKSFEVTFNV